MNGFDLTCVAQWHTQVPTKLPLIPCHHRARTCLCRLTKFERVQLLERIVKDTLRSVIPLRNDPGHNTRDKKWTTPSKNTGVKIKIEKRESILLSLLALIPLRSIHFAYVFARISRSIFPPLYSSKIESFNFESEFRKAFFFVFISNRFWFLYYHISQEQRLFNDII